MNTISRAAYEGDIASRLRNWRGLHLAHSGMLFEEAADEIERLRLTDAERDALVQAIGIVDWNRAYFSHPKADEPLPSATLRGLLARTK